MELDCRSKTARHERLSSLSLVSLFNQWAWVSLSVSLSFEWVFLSSLSLKSFSLESHLIILNICFGSFFQVSLSSLSFCSYLLSLSHVFSEPFLPWSPLHAFQVSHCVTYYRSLLYLKSTRVDCNVTVQLKILMSRGLSEMYLMFNWTCESPELHTPTHLYV